MRARIKARFVEREQGLGPGGASIAGRFRMGWCEQGLGMPPLESHAAQGKGLESGGAAAHFRVSQGGAISTLQAQAPVRVVAKGLRLAGVTMKANQTWAEPSARHPTPHLPARALGPIKCAKRSACGALGAAFVLMAPLGAMAGDRLLGTWGVSEIEGAGGGGLTPWAIITGSGSGDQTGGSSYATVVHTQSGHELRATGVALGVRNRLELSLSRWSLKVSDRVLPGKSLEMSTLGAKWRITGDAVYDQDVWWPQVSVGAQYKQADDTSLLQVLGARSSSDVDLYVSATKVWLGALAGRHVLANLTLRSTRANQFGLLGFGGPGHEARSMVSEGSLAVMPRDDLAVGVEFRQRPNNLAAPGFEERAAKDVFLAWFASRHLSITTAWVDLGNVATLPRQRGWYLSAQAAF
jgi:hypothetical protein